MLPPPNGPGVADTEFSLLGVVRTFRVNPDATTTPIVLLTAMSKLFQVTYSWFVTEANFLADGAPALAQLKTTEVNAICHVAHVQAFRTEQDQDRSGLLFNQAVITVGTPDLRITTDVLVRMDQIGNASTYALIDAAWALLLNLGAGVEPPLG